jgi:polysaccharide export outer membrane protein
MRKIRKMNSLSSWLLVSFISVFVFLCFSQVGCGRIGDRTAVEAVVIPSQTAMEIPVEVTSENLSMAKELRKSPPLEYVLGPGDSVEISVFQQDEMKMEATISASGNISYYLVGDIQAGGLTQFQLRDHVEKAIAKFVKDPHVLVRITEYRSHKIFVLGQVNKPGVYIMRNNFSLVEGISAAGGIAPDAYLGGAYVVRDGKVLLINFQELIENGNMEENILLLSNDVIYIPDNRDRKIFVLGEVNRQTALPISDGMTLLEAIAEAGGFTRDARKGSILVMRGNLSEPEILKIDATHMDLVAGILLKPGDVVYAASSSVAKIERIAMRLSNILKPFLSVARGIILTDSAYDVLKYNRDRSISVGGGG